MTLPPMHTEGESCSNVGTRCLSSMTLLRGERAGEFEGGGCEAAEGGRGTGGIVLDHTDVEATGPPLRSNEHIVWHRIR